MAGFLHLRCHFYCQPAIWIFQGFFSQTFVLVVCDDSFAGTFNHFNPQMARIKFNLGIGAIFIRFIFSWAICGEENLYVETFERVKIQKAKSKKQKERVNRKLLFL